MKSKMLFFGLLLGLLMSNAVHSTDYQIDKFNLDLHAGRVASYLWQGAKVPAEEIDRVCNSVIRTARNSDASRGPNENAAKTCNNSWSRYVDKGFSGWVVFRIDG